MNKKFSTLVAAFAILGASASAQTLPTTSAVADSIVVGEYYYLANDAGNKYLSIAKTSTSNKDSLVLAGTADKAALWTVGKGATVALGDYFTFTNVSTGKALKLDKKGNAIISSAATGIDKFGWAWTNGGAAAALTNITDGKTYTLVASATDSLSLSDGTTTTVTIKPMLPAWRKMTATELNEINGNSFKWTVAGTTSKTTQATNSAKAFNEFALKAIPTTDPTVMYLEKVGSLNATTTKGAYLNVDTVYYTRTGALIDSTLTSGGLTFALDTLTNAAVIAVAKAGKRVESFQFVVWTNAKDSIVLEVQNIPSITSTGATFAANANLTTPGFVSLVGFDGTTKALTASKKSSANVLPSVSFGAGTKVELAAGAYFIYKQTGDSAYVASLATTLADAEIVKAKAGYEKAWMPSTQWAVATTSNKPVFTNREANEAFTAATPYLYASGTENVYYYGGDTLKIVPVATEGIYVGYKKMGKTAAEEKVTKLALQFHSALTDGTTPYVFKSTGDSIMKVANRDKSDALFFNVLPVDTFAIGSDSLKVVSYKLFNGKDTLAYDNTRSAYVLSSSDQDQTFIFRETSTQGWYQVLPIATVSANAWELDGQVSVSGTSAEVVLNSDLNKINGYFSLEAPLEPEYATIENAPAHKRIASVENPTLAISMNSDSCAVLKAVTELKAAAFEKQNFSMYLDVYDTDTVKPLYLITTQQTLAMDSASYANDVRYFMFAAGGGAIADSLGFKKAMRIGVDRDSLHVYNVPAAKDTVKPADMKPYTFAFMKSNVEGEYYIESQKAGAYMAQKNGVLHLVANTENALLFTVNPVAATDLPTSNDQVAVETVKVIAGQGQVTIIGAAGKKVVISNILGQAIVNTVIASDNAVIAAPSGVVVVAVEGEEAVKAIVK